MRVVYKRDIAATSPFTIDARRVAWIRIVFIAPKYQVTSIFNNQLVVHVQTTDQEINAQSDHIQVWKVTRTGYVQAYKPKQPGEI